MIPATAPLISVIVPLYNAEETIAACLKSCMGQTYGNMEIIAVDDGSTDNSWNIACEFSRAHPAIRLYRQKRGGVTAARNHGIRQACGEYLFFLDADDELPSRSLEFLMKKALETNADITAGTALHLTDKGSVITYMNYLPFSCLSGEKWLETVRKTWQGHLWGLLIKKDLFSPPLHCPHSLKIGEDLLQVVQLAMRCGLVAMTEEIVYRYIKRDTSAINARKLPSSISGSDEFLFVEAMQLILHKTPSPHMKTECRLLALFSVLNLPPSDYRKKLMRHFRLHFLSCLLGNRRVAARLWEISPRLYAGILLECVK